MAIKTKDELLTTLKQRTAEDTTDETLTFIEDVTDTLNDLEAKTKEQTDWKKKYEENDSAWREKYKERFFEPSAGGYHNGKGGIDDHFDIDNQDDEEKKPKTFEDLFTIEK